MATLASQAETQFRELIRRARVIDHAVADVSARWSRQRVGRADTPDNTARKLECLGRLHFDAGITLLGEPWLAHVADVHVRPLLEVYAHTAWIREKRGSYPRTTPTGRAQCIEMRWAQGLVREWREVPRSLQSPQLEATRQQALSAADQAYEYWKTAHMTQPCNCNGQGRGDAQVKKQLKVMAAHSEGWWEAYPWLFGSSSRVVHASAIDRLVQQLGDGTPVMAPASFVQRAQSFGWLIALYADLADWVLEPFDKTAGAELANQLRNLFLDPAMRHAVEGSLDGPLTEC